MACSKARDFSLMEVVLWSRVVLSTVALANGGLKVWLAARLDTDHGRPGFVRAADPIRNFPPLRVVLPTLLATALVCVSSLARQWLQRWSLAGLVAFQGFLLPLELVIHLAMTYAGRNFVILTGLLALPLACWPCPWPGGWAGDRPLGVGSGPGICWDWVCRSMW